MLLSYDFPFRVYRGVLNYGVEGHYTDDFYTDLPNFDADHAPGYFVANMHLGWTDETGHLNLSITAENTVNRLYETTGFDFASFCGCGEISYGDPCVVLGRVGYRYRSSQNMAQHSIHAADASPAPHREPGTAQA